MTRTAASVLVLVVLALGACGDELVEIVPACDEIDWPLGLDPVRFPPVPEYAVECAAGWGNGIETQPELDTRALPGVPWFAKLHPDGGWVMQLAPPGYRDEWDAWLASNGIVDPVDPIGHPLVRVMSDGAGFGWAVSELSVWSFDFVADELWVVARDLDDQERIAIVDASSGAILDSRAWQEASYNRLLAARDVAGGAWVTTLDDLDDGLVEHALFRVTSLDQIEQLATRTTVNPRTSPSGAVHALEDGAAVWSTGEGFELIEPDGSVRWARSEGWVGAAQGDTMLVVRRQPTGVGAGRALALEQVSLLTGASIWTREYRRFDVAEPEQCGPEGCALLDYAHPHVRPDGGYLLVGRQAYPSATCSGQPWVMAITSGGDAQWAHRVEICGTAWGLGARPDGSFEILGISKGADEGVSLGGWVRSYAG
ncbi:hypothetical protein DB30_06276 [Enhygromyxa salina]|uniref:Uncharacterized protein n=1 Tax=Enhygromyxa salina TaxID=215803 RepID=A0A0C1ZUT8_9BACT|nr:hypothetical protein [Enhygromyxa salina]KIG14823.1 hypothetical protein DB30_06276 [Enhygromyxa salina]